MLCAEHTTVMLHMQPALAAATHPTVATVVTAQYSENTYLHAKAVSSARVTLTLPTP